MFGVRKLYEQRIEDLKVEHGRMVKLMADEIEYLRAQLVGARLAQQHRQQFGPEEHDFMPDARTSPHFVSEEEEDLRALRDNGHIEEYEYRRAMAALGRAVGGVDIQVDADNDPDKTPDVDDEARLQIRRFAKRDGHYDDELGSES